MAFDPRNPLPAIHSRDEGIHSLRAQDALEKNLKEAELVSWKLVYTKQAQKDAKKLSASGLKKKAEELMGILEKNPFQNPPPFEKLVGDLAGAYSRRINIQHRLVYQVLTAIKTVKVIRLWTHYE